MPSSSTFKQSHLFQAVFQSSTEGILICNSKGVIIQANPACYRIFGYPEGGLDEKPISDLLPPDIRERHHGHIKAFFANPQPRPMGKGLPLFGARPDGSSFPLEISLSHSEVDGVEVGIAFISDLSAKQAKEAELSESRSRFDSVIEAAIDGIIVIDSKGFIDLVNPAVERLFGYSSEELRGKKINVLMPNPYRDEHDGYIRNYQNTGEKKIIGIGREVKGKKKDGTIFPFNLSVNEVKLGGKTLYTGIIHDLTQQKAYEQQLKEYSEQLEIKVKSRTKALEEVNTYLEEQMEALMQAQDAVRRSEHMYKLIARNFPNGTINVFDKELKYVFVEGKELFELGITSEKLIGTKFIDRLDPQIASQAEQELMQVFTGEPRSFEIDFQGNNYVLNAVPLTESDDGSVNQILVVERNITRQKKAEEDIRKALEKEQQLGELKSRFVTMASHEFRTPLTTIASSATLIGKYTQGEQQDKRDKHIGRIKSNVKHLTNILNDFLSLGKLEEGRISNHPEPLHMESFCSEIIEELEPSLESGKQIVYEQHGLDTAMLDSKLLRHILINLLSNAIKYSKPNSRIWLNIDISEKECTIAVRDEGIGIPREDMEHLFSRFFRATNTGNIQGTGMGLNIVKKYLDLMGGSITVDSQLNQGTTFTIYFNPS